MGKDLEDMIDEDELGQLAEQEVTVLPQPRDVMAPPEDS